MNISISDITYGLSDDVKQNILEACSECARSGYNRGIEFASLLDAITGKPLDGYSLLEGTPEEVDISGWTKTLEKAKPLSLIILHNHTIVTPFTRDDIYVFLSHPSIQSSIVTIEDWALYLEKTERSVCDYNLFMQEAKKNYPGKSLLMSDGKVDINKVVDFMISTFKNFEIVLRRWP